MALGGVLDERKERRQRAVQPVQAPEQHEEDLGSYCRGMRLKERVWKISEDEGEDSHERSQVYKPG